MIQARMGSTRLPGKVLKPIAGRPLLWHIVHRLKASRHIDAVAVHGAVRLLHNVAQMQPQAKAETAVVCGGIRASLQLVLNGKRGCSRPGGGLENRQHRIARGVDDSAAVGDADRLEGPPCDLERFDRSASVDRHQSRVRGGIRCENCGESKTKLLGPHVSILNEFSVLAKHCQATPARRLPQAWLRLPYRPLVNERSWPRACVRGGAGTLTGDQADMYR